MRFKFLLVWIPVICFIGGHAQTADEIIAKYFANTGGIEKWKTLTSRTSIGKAFFGQEFPMTRYEMAPNKQKVVIDIQGTVLIPMCFDGTTAWTLNPLQGGKDPVKVPEEQARELKDEQFENSFIDYKKKGHEVTMEGIEDVDGVKCFKLKLIKNKNNDKDDATEIHFIDAENFVPLVVSRFIRSGPQTGTEIRSYLSDYQEVGGLMFPFSIEQKVNGQTASKITLEKITINDIKDEGIFAFPKP